MNKEIIIIGGFHEVIELCEDLDYIVVGIIDNNLSGYYLGYPILGTDQDAHVLYDKYSPISLVVTPDSPTIRNSLFKHYSSIGFTFETIISSRSKISKSATVGVGAIIQDGVNVSANTSIGAFAKLNTGCNVMHDCNIGDFATIAPNAVILGKTTIGKYSYIGANSTILPNKIICDNVVVGAGAVVTKNVKSNKIVKGIPAE